MKSTKDLSKVVAETQLILNVKKKIEYLKLKTIPMFKTTIQTSKLDLTTLLLLFQMQWKFRRIYTTDKAQSGASLVKKLKPSKKFSEEESPQQISNWFMSSCNWLRNTSKKRLQKMPHCRIKCSNPNLQSQLSLNPTKKSGPNNWYPWLISSRDPKLIS